MDPVERLARARSALEAGRLREAEILLRAPLPPPWEPERRLLLGEALRGRGLIGAAARELERVLRLPPGSDPALWCEAALAWAACQRSLGAAKRAGAALDKAGRLIARRGLGYLARPLELERAMVLRAQGRWAAALTALRRLKGGADGAERAYIDWALGGAHRFRGRFSEAVKSFESSRAGFRRAGDRLGEGYAECGLAGARRVQGLAEECVRHYSRALVLFSGGEDLFGLAYAHCGLANGLRQAGRYRDAERYYRLAEGLYRRLEDPADLGYVEWGWGEVLLRTGRRREARVRLGESHRLFSGAGELRGRVLAELSLAALDHAEGFTPRAERRHAGALRAARSAGIHTHLEIFT